MKYLLFISFLICTCNELHSQVRLPRLVSDSMVLQRGKKIKIWGWASPAEEIKIRIAGQQHKVRANTQGKWMVTLSPLRAGGPYEMDIAASNKIVLRDIMVGEVWICSGQSNMEISMERVKDKYPEEMNAGNPYIRQFNVATRFEFDRPLDDLASGRWETFTPGQIRGFTAVGYFFAKALYEKYKIPIGLIESASGGAPAEAWLSEDALAQFPTQLTTAMRYRNK